MMANQFIVQAGNPLLTQSIPCAMCGKSFTEGALGVLVPMPGAPETGFYVRHGADNLNAVPVHVECIERANDLFSKTAEFGRFVLMVMEGTAEWDADMTDLIAGKAVNMGLAETDQAGMFKSRFREDAPPAETVHSEQPAPDTNEDSQRPVENAEGSGADGGDQRDPGT